MRGSVVQANATPRSVGRITTKLARVWTSVQNLAVAISKRINAIRTRKTPIPMANMGIRLNSPSPTNPSFLLVCIKGRRYATNLYHQNVQDVKSDQELFRNLRSVVFRHSWTHFFSLRTLTGIRFVEFTVCPRQLVSNLTQNRIPPSTQHAQYMLRPWPDDRVPRLCSDYLMHHFEYPECGDGIDLCLDQFPKKLKSQLEWCRNEENIGWGIYFIEGIHVAKLCLALFALASGSLVFGVVYWYKTKDIQGAYTVASYMTALTGLLLGTWQSWDSVRRES